MLFGYQFPINSSAKPSCQLIALHTTNTTSGLLMGASWFLIPPPRRLSAGATPMLPPMSSPLWGCPTSSSPIDELLVIVWTTYPYQATLKNYSLELLRLTSREESLMTLF